MLLRKSTIYKFKCFTTPQTIILENGITRIVGKNESGKTALLNALAKINYFDSDTNFKYNVLNDYNRNTLIDDGGEKECAHHKVIECEYIIDDKLKEEIINEIGIFILKGYTVHQEINYDYSQVISLPELDYNALNCYVVKKLKLETKISPDELETFKSLKELSDIQAYFRGQELNDILSEFNKIFTGSDWNDFIIKKFIIQHLPVFWYFGDYYQLPNIINLQQYKSTESAKIIDALFDLAKINVATLTTDSDYERARATLEATANSITRKIFKYWSTNKHLKVIFDCKTNANHIREFHIRIENQIHNMSLPLNQRSRGFNWFFSFLIWFSRIQGDKNKQYILLLDEPGLSLHAAAQKDLLRFIEDELKPKYQVIYTTHSPFMIENTSLNEVRTIYDTGDAEQGSIISDSIQEKDPDTLFPLQAALGYDLAQNLFINKKNLLVEGVSDLIYLSAISEELKNHDRIGLNDDISIVPVGGLDKVATFISLLRGQDLQIACLLDDTKIGRQSLENLIKNHRIKNGNIQFFDEFTEKSGSDIEDVFTPKEYLYLFNIAFDEQISEADIDTTKPILKQIDRLMGQKRFNHYKPANEFLKISNKYEFLSKNSINIFEKIFSTINKILH